MRRMNRRAMYGWLEVAWVWGTLIVGIVLAVRGHVWAGLVVLLVSESFAFWHPRSRRASADSGKGTERAASDADAWRGRFAGDVRALVAKLQRDGDGGFVNRDE